MTKLGRVMEVRENSFHRDWVTMTVGYGRDKPMDYINVLAESQRPVGSEVSVTIQS